MTRFTADDKLLMAFVQTRDEDGDPTCCSGGKRAVLAGGWRWFLHSSGDRGSTDTLEDGLYWIGRQLVDLGILNPPWVEGMEEGYFGWEDFFDPNYRYKYAGSETLRWAFPISLLKWGVREWDRMGRPPLQ